MLELLMAYRSFDNQAPTGPQILYAEPGTRTFTVPNGVFSICVVCIGGGWKHDMGGGGGLAWRNDIPVNPGDRLTVVVGGPSQSAGSSLLNAQGEILCVARGGTFGAGGLGGKNASAVNHGGGDGGGGYSNSGGSWAAGGAGGYSGKGGSGGWVGTSGAGGGGGGGTAAYESPSRPANGGGVLPYGQGANGAAGSNNPAGRQGSALIAGNISVEYGGGGPVAGGGCVRLIWGPGRAFPSTNVADIE